MTSNEQPCYTTTPTPTPATRPATTPTNIDDKVPKTWPPQKYQRLIQAYRDNSGNTRHLPEKTVLGAEKMLVRMWHEHHKSKVYTAVTLREIITNRTFTALGTVLADILPQPLPTCPKGDKGKGQGKGKRQRLLGSTQGIPKDVETYGPSPRPIQQYSQPFPPTPPPPQNQQAFPPTRDKANSITPKDNRRGNAKAHGRASTRDSAARRLQHHR